MAIPIREAISRADTAIRELGHAPSTLCQYRWAWSQIGQFCSDKGEAELTEGSWLRSSDSWRQSTQQAGSRNGNGNCCARLSWCSPR